MRKTLIAAVLGTTLVLLGAQLAFSAMTRTVVTGRTPVMVKMVRADPADANLSQQDASSANRPWVTIPGATASLAIPSGQRGIFLTTFSAGHRCTGVAPANGADSLAGWGCVLRVVVNGFPLTPHEAQFAAGDLQRGQVQVFERTSSMQFSSAILPAGTYNLEVQYKSEVGADDIQVQWLIRYFHFTVERIQV